MLAEADTRSHSAALHAPWIRHRRRILCDALDMSLLGELRQRKVFRVAVAYALVAWVLIQVASVIAPALPGLE
jgi:hypothetical protein